MDALGVRSPRGASGPDLGADELAGILASGEKTAEGYRLDFSAHDGGTITFELGTSEVPLADDFLIRRNETQSSL